MINKRPEPSPASVTKTGLFKLAMNSSAPTENVLLAEIARVFVGAGCVGAVVAAAEIFVAVGSAVDGCVGARTGVSVAWRVGVSVAWRVDVSVAWSVGALVAWRVGVSVAGSVGAMVCMALGVGALVGAVVTGTFVAHATMLKHIPSVRDIFMKFM